MEIQERKIVFGQIVIGPPGSGKTTYCQAISKYLIENGRNVKLINLDPGNELQRSQLTGIPNECIEPDIDIFNLINIDEVMSEHHLGPNGGLIYCIEFLEKNFHWLEEELIKAVNLNEKLYLIIDCPGQVELYTHHQSLKNIFHKFLTKNFPIDLRLVCVNLVDSHYCNDTGKYISAVLNCLLSMVHIEMPFLNVLSKIDLTEKHGKIDFSLEYYTDVLDLNYLIGDDDDEENDDNDRKDFFLRKYKKLTKSIAGVIEDYGLVSFIPLDINKQEMLINLIKLIDRANGFMYNDN